MSKIYTVKLSEEQLEELIVAGHEHLRVLKCTANDADYQHIKDLAAKSVPVIESAMEELKGARCHLEESKL
jgi:hypothetical protein